MIILLLFCALLIVAATLFIRVKMPAWKGKFSENLVNRKLLGLPDEYVVFSDLLFENNGYSTQIDHLVVSPYGVFVIETKGYKGWIFGGEYTEKWTQNIYGRKYDLYNPIKQNDGHVRLLRHLLKCSTEILFVPIVVFNNDASLKVRVREHIVINRCQLNSVIQSYREVALSNDMIKRITQTILSHATLPNKENMQHHKTNVEYRKYRNRQSIYNGICPDCGGKLVERHGKFGRFYGCSNYPKCRFTQK